MNMDPRRPNPALDVYAAAAIAQAPRLLSQLDRDPQSPAYGCFDRDHWSWKFRDFPLGMLQSCAYPLALLWRYPYAGNPYHASAQLLEWIGASLRYTLDRQHRNGAFDAFSPYEQDGGCTLGVLHGVLETARVLGDALDASLRSRLVRGARRAAGFALTYDEPHGFISNHRALFAVAFLDVWELTADERYRRRAEELIAGIMEHQSSDGWYMEYGGTDPGYESLGIFHLSTYWQRTGSAALLTSLERAVDFYAWCVHPDGSAGGVYGSRHTTLYFPGGFEALAPVLPRAASIARFLRERLQRGNVVTPSSADTENLPPLLYSYLEAGLAAGAHTPGSALPCETFQGRREFPHSGIGVHATASYYCLWNEAKGGLCRAFDRHSGRIVYEDAGYVLRAGDKRWASQRLGLGHKREAENGEQVQTTTHFSELAPQMLTPARFLLLRILNLTLFRWPAAAAWLRRRIARRLISDASPGPFTLRRNLRFAADSIRIDDRIESLAGARVQSVELCRCTVAMHMGSARYFHFSDLEPVPLAGTTGMAESLSTLGYAEHRTEISFPLPAKRVQPLAFEVASS